MTPSAAASPGTAANLLFGPGAHTAEPLARQIMSAAGTELDQAWRRLPQPTRQAALRETAAAAAGLLDVRLDGLLLAGWRLHHDLAAAARRTLAFTWEHRTGHPGQAPGHRRPGAGRRRPGGRPPGGHDPSSA